MQVSAKNYNARIFEGWQDPDGVKAHQQFRKQLFVDGLGWRLSTRNDLEQDEFDTDHAVYCLLLLEGKVIGGWRAVQTTQDYLSQMIFPQLATLRDYPSRPDVWEISRLGVLPHPKRLLSGRLVYALMVKFAMTRNARSLIGVIDVAHARNMDITGIKTRRFGAPQIVGINSRNTPITAFCAELRLAEQGGKRFEKLIHRIDSLEIKDEAFLQGPARVSA